MLGLAAVTSAPVTAAARAAARRRRRTELGDHLLDEPPTDDVLGLVRVDASLQQRAEHEPVLRRIVAEQPLGHQLMHE